MPRKSIYLNPKQDAVFTELTNGYNVSALVFDAVQNYKHPTPVEIFTPTQLKFLWQITAEAAAKSTEPDCELSDLAALLARCCKKAIPAPVEEVPRWVGSRHPSRQKSRT